MILPYGIKEIVCPMLNKTLNEYNITCPLHYFSYPRFKNVLLEKGYEFINSEDIFINKESMDLIHISLESGKTKYLLEVATTLTFEKLKAVYEEPIIKEFKNKYVLVEGLSYKVNEKLKTEDFDQIKSSIPENLLTVLEKSLWNYEDYCSKYSNYNISNTLGILVYGAPGVGKTYALRSYLNKLMIERNFTIVQVYQDCLDNINMSVMLESCSKLFPCILFIEDIDIKYKDRFENSPSLAGQLLETFEGLSRAEKVVLIATSNSYDTIEKALLRPGRIDYVIKIDKPTYDLKLNILSQYLENIDFKLPKNLKDCLLYNAETLAELNGGYQHIIRSYISDGNLPPAEEVKSMISKWKDTRNDGNFSSKERPVGLV